MRKDFIEPHERRALVTIAAYAQKHGNVTLQRECDAELEAIRRRDQPSRDFGLVRNESGQLVEDDWIPEEDR